VSWQVIARKEVKDALRARVLHALSGMLVLLALALMGLYASIPALFGAPQSELSLSGFIMTLGAATAFVPIIGGVLGYKAVAGERASGSLALMLSQPHSRDDVVIGKFVGRVVVLAVPVTLAFAAGFGVVLVGFDAYSLVDYVTFLALLVLLGAVYVSVAVGTSASTASTTKAAVGVLGYYLVFKFLWGPLALASNALWQRVTTGEWVVQFGGFPDWVYLLLLLSPHNAYQVLLRSLVLTDAPAVWFGTPSFVNAGTALTVMLLWIVVPLTVGLWRFDAVDL
jgi:ABC-2 type transport system permease protein